MKKVWKTKLGVLVTALVTGCASQAPQETHDGLVLQPDSKFQEVYILPGADLSSYTEFGLADCSVAFRKNWLRDQNNSRMDLTRRVTQKDVDKIKDSLGEECTRFFRQSLQEAPPYQLVDEFENGEAVLVLRPAIINLDINAPDTMSPGINRTYTTSTGEMTLSLELFDGTTGQALARIVDRRRAPDMGRLQWTSGVTNKAEADRTLKRWAKNLREGLDKATGR
ncbi:DUF3313 family protein [Pseudohalioglobus lutimaris]|uniref:DUF3313 domain-containing protein n=1 Tax=Pseudohalioglobus lutimaris TaxID=1737061 RepID=A0A2N5X238_9GAMM|nr:DUF3313 family protein [Pseudohalioglobus lutimaris]PLW68555.1 hypothetical protein C0039_12345 [Pseudohalioglobus lutimaris]